MGSEGDRERTRERWRERGSEGEVEGVRLGRRPVVVSSKK